jgi:hypothetical protein
MTNSCLKLGQTKDSETQGQKILSDACLQDMPTTVAHITECDDCLVPLFERRNICTSFGALPALLPAPSSPLLVCVYYGTNG